MAERLKIAVYHNLPSGGGKRALFNHVKALKERGHIIEAWTSDLEMNFLSLGMLVPEHRIGMMPELEKVFNRRSPIKKISGMIDVLKSHAAQCASEIEKGGFDIVFANSSLYSYISYIGLFTRLPSVIYLGEPYRMLYEAMPENIWQAPSYSFNLRNINKFRQDFLITYARRIQVREEIRAARSYRSVLVNSLYSRESIRRAYGIDAKVCYLGIDGPEFDNVSLEKLPYVAGLGKITRSKGIDLAIKSIALIDEKVRPLLKWISNGYDEPYFSDLKTLARDLRVDFEPLIDIDHKLLKETLGQASVMIYTPALEPFGLAPLEANMCGTWVIGIAEAGVRETICDGVNGTLFMSFDPALVASEIEKFIADPVLASTKGAEARKHTSARWSFRSMGDNIEKELLKALQDN